MAQTIQLRRGTGSAVPSSLAEGELALNVDSGKLFYGKTSTSASSNFRVDSITAENYIVCSSVSNITTQALSGSTAFGDSADDTHQFTGSIHVDGLDYNAGVLTITDSDLNEPKIIIHNTTAQPYGEPTLTFKRDHNTDDTDIGNIVWNSKNTSGTYKDFVSIVGEIAESQAGQEGGQLRIEIKSHDGETVTGFTLTDGDAEDEVDVTIGNTATSLTTIAGDLQVNGNDIKDDDGTTCITFDSSGKTQIGGSSTPTTIGPGLIDFNPEANANGIQFKVDDTNSKTTFSGLREFELGANRIELGTTATQHVTASGNISASGYIYSDNFLADNGNHIIGHHVNDGLQIRTQNSDPIVFKTNGNNIRATIAADGTVNIVGDLDLDGSIVGDGNTSLSGIDTITATGHISTSGDLHTEDDIYMKGVNSVIFMNDPIQGLVANSSNAIKINSGFANPSSVNHLVVSSSGGTATANARIGIGGMPDTTNMLTVYGDISSSSDLLATDLTLGGTSRISSTAGTIQIQDHLNIVSGQHITASGNISANGNIVGDGATDISGIDQITTSTIRLTSTTDASATSTAHAFQSGPTSGNNIIINGNEIMSRNNGVIAALHLNPDGGNVSFNVSTDDNVRIGSGHITASGNISSSGVTEANVIRGNQIQATFNGATRTLFSEVTNAMQWGEQNITTYRIGKPTSNSHLQMEGHITASGDISSTGGTIKAGWHNSTTRIKILVSDFIPDDIGRPAMIDDTGSDRWLESHSTGKLFASIPIPTGFKATHVRIYGSATSAFTVIEMDIDSKSVTLKGSGNIGTELDITDVTSTDTNYLLLELDQASGEEVYGGYVTIAAV